MITSPNRRFKSTACLAFGIPAACLAMSWTPVAHAQEPSGGARAQQAQSAENVRHGGGTTRLQYFRKDWETVLSRVATDTGSKLIMTEIPAGHYTRTDLSLHDRESAVRVLNRDLEKTGYRLISKDDTLYVVSTRRERREYDRTVYSQQQPQRVDATPPPVQHAVGQSTGQGSGVVQAAGMRPAAENTSQTIEPARSARQRALEEPSRLQFGSRIRPVNHTQEEVKQETPASPTSLTIQPKRRSALDIARQLHGTFRDRASTKTSGPNGLQAISVEDFAAESPSTSPLFTLEVDTTSNRLIVTAVEPVQKALQKLIDRIDLNPLSAEADRMPTLIAGDGDLATTGESLKQPLSLLAQYRQQGNPVMVAQQEATTQRDAQQPQAGGGEETFGVLQGVDPDLGVLLGTLKGDVQIESLPDLDLLIIRGNEEDVEKVKEVINKIEQMAIGSMPEIHLLRLRYVDSQSMATLLTDVYARMAELRTNAAQQSLAAVQVVPVVTPNAILILASGRAMPSVLELAETLDQPIDPLHEVQVFRLKHAVASNVVTMLEGMFEEQVGASVRLRVAADERTNSLIVQAKPNDLMQIAEVIRGVDADQAGAISRMEIIPLKSANATELSQLLNQAIFGVLNPPVQNQQGLGGVGGFQGGQQQNTSNMPLKSQVLELLSDGDLVRSGILNDIRFNADPRTNSLLVNAPEGSMSLVKELVKLLDRPSPITAEIKIYPLVNADANDAVELLSGLFPQQQQGQQGFGGQQAQQGLGFEFPETQGTTSSLIPLRFWADARTNSVLAVGGPEAMSIIEGILLQLDTRSARKREISVYQLRNTYAPNVSDAVNQFLEAQLNLATLDPERISTSQLLEQEVIVTPETTTNSLIISATPEYFEQIMQVIRQLDDDPRQVMIQAALVEVTLQNTDEFGVELGLQSGVLFNRSILEGIETITQTTQEPGLAQVTTTQVISSSATPGFSFNNQPLGNNTGVGTNPSQVGGQGLSNFALGRSNSDLGYGGLVLSASSESVSVLIRALAARRNVRVLSRPQILALHQQPAQIQVGQVVPVIDGVTITGTGIVNPNIIRDNAGVILTVTPRISPEGQIVMDVTAEKSVYPGNGVPVFTDPTTGAVIESPIKEITTAVTSAKVLDGQTIVLGGMITKSDTTEERKVPWLGDLPIIGKAFRYDFYDNRRTELLIFLTPRIIRSDADVETIKQVEAARLHWFQDDAEAVHGPIFGVPNAMAMPIENCPPLELPPHSSGYEPSLPVPPPALEKSVPPPPTSLQFDEMGGPRRASAANESPNWEDNVFRLGEIPANAGR